MAASAIAEKKNDVLTVINGPRYAVGPHTAIRGSLQIRSGKLQHLYPESMTSPAVAIKIDLEGFLMLPGLVNAHDHLQYALHPRIGNPPYNNYVEWGDDIHATVPDVISRYNSVPREIRLWWGGIRNVLCGVTSVCHHDSLWPALQSEGYPVKVLTAYGWAHSVGLAPDIHKAWAATPDNCAFFVHVSEGTDERARGELAELDKLGMLSAKTVIVHGLALGRSEMALLQERQSSLVLCLSSNKFLYDRLPDPDSVRGVKNTALGNDSPLTAMGDLLDEIRFAIEYASIPADVAYRMVTELPAEILRLRNGEGYIHEGGSADLIAVRDNGDTPCKRLTMLSWRDVEFVMIEGEVQLASEVVWQLIPSPAKEGMEPVWIDGYIRWLRAPVGQLTQKAEAVLGPGMLRLGGRKVQLPNSVIPASRIVPDRPMPQSEARL